MTDERIKYWFNGFEKGIMNLSNNEEREKFFSKCGKSCADVGVIDLYKKLYEDANHNIDEFFLKSNTIDGVKSEIIEKNKAYYLIFEHCLCSIPQSGYFNNPILCECSKQSIIYVLKTIIKDRSFKVEMCKTVLKGDDECRYKITRI